MKLDEKTIVALHHATSNWIDRHAPRAYLIGRLGILAADAAADPFLMAESHRLQLAVCVNRRFIVEAAHHATAAALLYRAPGGRATRHLPAGAREPECRMDSLLLRRRR